MLVEAVLAPRSRLIGQTLRSAHFREKHDVNVIAVWRAGRPIRTSLSDLPLEFGDALLLLGPRKRLHQLRSEPDLIVLNDGESRSAARYGTGWSATMIMAATLLVATLSKLPIGEVLLAGAIAMILAGVLTMDQAYAAVDWKSVFLIAGMLPMGIAIAKTGIADSAGNWLILELGGYGVQVLLAGFVLLTVLLSQVMNGAAVAAVMVPIAVGAASQVGADPRALAMGVALATSITFITPFGHPANVLVMGPGAYRIRDYVRVGLPLTVLLLILVILLLPMFWPLTTSI
jgi:di/tricarboxylate transporter